MKTNMERRVWRRVLSLETKSRFSSNLCFLCRLGAKNEVPLSNPRGDRRFRLGEQPANKNKEIHRKLTGS